MTDLREFPRALELAKTLYREKKHLRATQECGEIAEILGVTNMAVWNAYQRGDLGVPSPNPVRAKAWALNEPFYYSSKLPCKKCDGRRRIPGDGVCYDCTQAYAELTRRR